MFIEFSTLEFHLSDKRENKIEFSMRFIICRKLFLRLYDFQSKPIKLLSAVRYGIKALRMLHDTICVDTLYWKIGLNQKYENSKKIVKFFKYFMFLGFLTL